MSAEGAIGQTDGLVLEGRIPLCEGTGSERSIQTDVVLPLELQGFKVASSFSEACQQPATGAALKVQKREDPSQHPSDPFRRSCRATR